MTNLGEAQLYIDGHFVEAQGGRRFDAIDPGTGAVIGTAADGGAPDIALAVTAARRAFDETEWSRDHALRHRCLVQLQEALRARRARIEEIVLSEPGICARYLPTHAVNPVEEMTFMIDLVGAFEWVREMPVHRTGAMASNRRVVHEPYGVAGAITAWNGPVAQNVWKVTHLLGTGNTMVLKPAAMTPFCAAVIAEAAAETDLPPGVFNLVTSSSVAEAGEALTDDPRVDLYHFTGSVGVGQRILEKAARGVRKTILELGGKSANIVLDDADVATVAASSVTRCMSTSGQGCVLPTRMLVHASIYDEVVERAAVAMRAVKWGDQRDPENLVGPIIRPAQVDRMAGLVERAAADGARVLVGGRRGDHGGKGFWFEPTLIVDAAPDSEIAQTEVFGPVLTIVRYEGDDAAAVRIANNTPYGLGGYVQTTSPARAMWIAERLRAGAISIGASVHMAADVPFGGYGASGLGREHGVEGFLECLQTKTIASPAA